MIWLAIFSLLVGAVLAQRFKVVVLVPATVMVLATATGTGFVQAQSAWWTILLAVAGTASIQIGYLAGLGIRYFLEASAPDAPPSFTAGASSRHPAR